MRKNFSRIIPMVLLLSVVSAEAGIRVVSDIDDTTKITNVGETLPSIWNGLFTSHAFSGMPELYSTWAKKRGYTFEYLTGAPSVLRPNVKSFIRKNRFPSGGLHLKPLLGAGSLREFKTRELKRIVDAHPDDLFIFVGDDTQHDFEVYDDIYKIVPSRILAIYIRKVTNHPVPPSSYPFLSAFDIARTEYLMGRLEVPQVAPTALAIIAEPRDLRIMPKFTYCPVRPHRFGEDPLIEKWTHLITMRIEKICEMRELPHDGY